MVFQELTRSALLGTDNTALSGDLLLALQGHGIREEQEPAKTLAEAAALHSQLRKAGYAFREYTGELVSGVIEEDKKACSHQSVNHLRLMLEGPYASLLPDFFRLLKAHGYGFPPQYIATLLLRADARQWMPRLLETIGARGHWLLRQHPAWGSLVEQPEVDWYAAGIEGRLLLLQYLRRHHPSLGLELVEQAWQESPLADRKEFLKALQTGLSMLDEPFLERCLDDSRKETRQSAASLLALLPASRYCERMYARAAACLAWDGERVGFHFPPAIGPEDERDGILLKKTSWMGGDKAAYLSQVCSRVPPSRWEDHFSDNPEGVIARMAQTEWFETWLAALAKAVRNTGGPGWLMATLRQLYKLDFMRYWELDDIPALIAMAEAEPLDALLLQALKNQAGVPDATSPAFALLKHCPHPWSEQVSTLLAARLQEAVGKMSFSFYETGNIKALLRMLGLRGSLSLLTRIRQSWPADRMSFSPLAPAYEQMMKTMMFRKEMETALSGK